jgi:hypothetical protein
MDFLFCYNDLTCHFDNFKNLFTGSKHPTEVVEVCQYYETQRFELPDYCVVKLQPPRRRSEF